MFFKLFPTKLERFFILCIYDNQKIVHELTIQNYKRQQFSKIECLTKFFNSVFRVAIVKTIKIHGLKFITLFLFNTLKLLKKKKIVPKNNLNMQKISQSNHKVQVAIVQWKIGSHAISVWSWLSSQCSSPSLKYESIFCECLILESIHLNVVTAGFLEHGADVNINVFVTPYF